MALKFLTYAEGLAVITGLSSDTKPVLPANGLVFIEEDTGKTYTITGGVWTESVNSSYPRASGLTKITVGTVEPTSPASGDLWVDTT